MIILQIDAHTMLLEFPALSSILLADRLKFIIFYFYVFLWLKIRVKASSAYRYDLNIQIKNKIK